MVNDDDVTSGRGDDDVKVSPRSQSESDDEDLAVSLAALSRLSAARLSLEALLTEVATFAERAIPGADGAGLTLREADRADTIVKSASFVREIDDIQYRVGQGPCISAAATGRPMRSGSLGGDQRWPRFGPRVSRLGVHSALSLPLISAGQVVGAMNVYAHAKEAFDERAEHLGQSFAIPAAIAVQNAQVLAKTQRLTAKLQSALTHRAVIDQAIGILMSRSGVSADQAYDRLRALSQTAEHEGDRSGRRHRGGGRPAGPGQAPRRTLRLAHRVGVSGSGLLAGGAPVGEKYRTVSP